MVTSGALPTHNPGMAIASVPPLPRRDKLHWSLTLDGQPHTLELLPGAFGSSVRITVDGNRRGSVRKPTRSEPWRLVPLDVAGTRIEVALTWALAAMESEVFVEGRSVIDGRSVGDAQRNAPDAISRYEDIVGAWFRYDRPTPEPLFERWGKVALGLTVLVFVIVALLAPVPQGLPRLVAYLAWMPAVLASFAAWVRSIGVVLARAHVWLIERNDLSTAVRVALWFGAMAAYGVGSFLAFFAFLYALDWVIP